MQASASLSSLKQSIFNLKTAIDVKKQTNIELQQKMIEVNTKNDTFIHTTLWSFLSTTCDCPALVSNPCA